MKNRKLTEVKVEENLKYYEISENLKNIIVHDEDMYNKENVRLESLGDRVQELYSIAGIIISSQNLDYDVMEVYKMVLAINLLSCDSKESNELLETLELDVYNELRNLFEEFIDLKSPIAKLIAECYLLIEAQKNRESIEKENILLRIKYNNSNKDNK